MSSSYVCSQCQRSLSIRPCQIQKLARLSRYPRESRRPLSTAPVLRIAQPRPYTKREEAKQPTSTLSASTSADRTPPKVAELKDTERQAQSPSQFSPVRSIAKQLRKSAGATTETYIAYASCERLVKECARQANYTMPSAEQKNVDIPKTKDGEDLGKGEGWWYNTLNLPPTFNTWAQVTFLHMYILTCRLRMLQYAATWHQHLLDHFFFMAEDRMTKQHGIVAGSTRSKYLKDLFVQWRGLTAGYDEGLVKGDAVLATAIWRNIFKGDENVDFRGVGQVVSYVRSDLRRLEDLADEDIASGTVVFKGPDAEKDGVLLRSQLMGTSKGAKDQSQTSVA